MPRRKNKYGSELIFFSKEEIEILDTCPELLNIVLKNVEYWERKYNINGTNFYLHLPSEKNNYHSAHWSMENDGHPGWNYVSGEDVWDYLGPEKQEKFLFYLFIFQLPKKRI